MARIEQLGLRSHVIVGTERTVVAALGDKRDGARLILETLPGVDKVVPVLAPYKMASREVKKEPTVVVARGLLGGGHLGVIAGPCSVESRPKILEMAHPGQGDRSHGSSRRGFPAAASPYSFRASRKRG